MIRSVLVPLDGSELAERALNYAQDVVAPGGRIILISVIELPADYEYALMDVPLTMMTASARMDEDTYKTAHARTLTYLEGKAAPFRARGFTVDYVIEMGLPADVIVEQAEALKVDAIVMSTHGRTGFSRWLFGSVAQKVVSSMPCPVMVVPGKIREDAAEEARASVSGTAPATSSS